MTERWETPLERFNKNNKTEETFKSKLDKTTCSINELITYKNEKYGNAALKPIGVFNKQGAENSILVRLDDKISRLMNSKELRKNDVSDLVGYLLLLSIHKDWTDFSEFMD